MLVLSRRVQEGLVLYDETGMVIRISVHELRGQAVRLAIDAPKCVRVLRDELPTAQEKLQTIAVDRLQPTRSDPQQ
jgi:carbon storage regulator CsrA